MLREFRKYIGIYRYFLRYLTFVKTFFKRKFQNMTKTVNLNVRVQIIFSTCKAQTLYKLHENVLINMWNNYLRGKNFIMMSSILAFSDDGLHKNACLIFLCICLMLMTKISYKNLKNSFLFF